jgi:hypothetical protein
MQLERVQLYRLAIVMAVGVAAGCSDSTGPVAPASVAPAENVVAEGTVGTVLATPPTFLVKDASGNSLGGVGVTVQVTAGGGTLTDAPRSTKSGPTPVGTWKLGNAAGLNSITVTVGALPPLVMSVTGKAGPPAVVEFVAGAGQSAHAGTMLPVRPVARVRDQFGNPVSATNLTFAVVEGGGSVSIATLPTDPSGEATVQWTLGRSAVPQLLSASSGSIGAVLSATVASDYDVDLRFFGPAMPQAAADMFTAAAARIRGSVTGDVSDIPASVFGTGTDFEQGCGVAGLPTSFSEGIDDVIVFASVGAIDGPGSILAFSGPCGIRGTLGSANQQTFIGVMKFDSDDIDRMIAQGNLTDVIQHEMLHVVGIGTLWGVYGLIEGAGTESTRFTGSFGVGACIELGGALVCPNSVPLENLGGPGTADGHWRESVFRTELMTGFITTPFPGFTGVLNPLSAMSIQSLADLGYVVNPAAADPYTIPVQSVSGILGLELGMQLEADETPWEKLVLPRLALSPAGRLTILQPPPPSN